MPNLYYGAYSVLGNTLSILCVKQPYGSSLYFTEEETEAQKGQAKNHTASKQESQELCSHS